MKPLCSRIVNWTTWNSFISRPIPLWLISQLNNMEFVYIATYSAVADIYILGNSQQCIMTEDSTLAYAICAITGKPPVIIPWTRQKCIEGDSLREL